MHVINLATQQSPLSLEWPPHPGLFKVFHPGSPSAWGRPACLVMLLVPITTTMQVELPSAGRPQEHTSCIHLPFTLLCQVPVCETGAARGNRDAKDEFLNGFFFPKTDDVGKRIQNTCVVNSSDTGSEGFWCTWLAPVWWGRAFKKFPFTLLSSNFIW